MLHSELLVTGAFSKALSSAGAWGRWQLFWAGGGQDGGGSAEASSSIPTPFPGQAAS